MTAPPDTDAHASGRASSGAPDAAAPPAGSLGLPEFASAFSVYAAAAKQRAALAAASTPDRRRAGAWLNTGLGVGGGRGEGVEGEGVGGWEVKRWGGVPPLMIMISSS